jgi:GH35 family endo-1,4-beta-xylanase
MKFWLTLTAAYLSTIPAWAITGSSLVLKSNGFDSGGTRTLQDNGYVGTYIDVPTAGSVTVSINAAGTASGGIDPRMNIVVGDYLAGFDVPTGSGLYEHTFDLPAGKHFIRTELANDPGKTGRQLAIQQLNVSGATIDNTNTNSNALAVANNYISNFRQGPANLMLNGATPGTQVQVKLTNHAFNFGANFPGSGGNTYFGNAQFTDFFKEHFNAAVPSNGGKWSVNDPQFGPITMAYADSIRSFAEANDMRFRMHALLWGTQNPGDIQTLLDDARNGDMAAKATLRTRISERIDYYVGDGDGTPNETVDRASRYFALDVLNEHVHQGHYIDIFSDSELADIFNEVRQAINATNGQVDMFLNEYNVLQFGMDSYGNWYRHDADAIVNAGGSLQGLGVQYYACGSAECGGSNLHSPARIHQILQNLSVGDFTLTLTEFGIGGDTTASEEEAADILEDSMRLFFGSPQADGFLHWGFWEGGRDFGREGDGILVRTDFTLTPAGERRQDLMDEWSTDLTLPVGSDGMIDFTGFFGEYKITIGGNTYALDLTKGTSDYSLIVGPASGDFDLDGDVDGRDFLTWQRGFGAEDATFAQGDANYDGEVDELDLAVWHSGYSGGALAASVSVPEPTCAIVMFSLCLFLNFRRDCMKNS